MSDEEKKPLVEITDVAGLSKPATALVNRLADACGYVYKPWGTIRQAEADAKAKLIDTQAAIDAATLEGRAAIRNRREQIWEQANVEAIIAQAVREELDKNVAPEGEMDGDWISQFINKAKRVYRKDMQGLWAKILAGETQKPGSFSLMTLHIVSTLTPADAEAFTNLCAFVTHGYRATGADPLVFDTAAKIYRDNGVTYSDVMHLEYMNLVIHQGVGVAIFFPKHERQELNVYGKDFYIRASLPEGHDRLSDGYTMFTRAGKELCRICEATAVEGFADYIIEEYNKKNIPCHLVAK